MQKRHPQKGLFFTIFWFLKFSKVGLFAFLAILGPPWWSFLVIFLASPFSLIFCEDFNIFFLKNGKVKTAQNTAPVHRIWLLPVWKKTRAGPKNTFKISLIFATFLAQIGEEKLKKTARAQKSHLTLFLGTPFWPKVAFWVDLGSRPYPKSDPKWSPEKNKKKGSRTPIKGAEPTYRYKTVSVYLYL